MSGTNDYLTPAQVCQTLKLTPTEVRMLIANGRLEVARHIAYKHGNMELFSLDQVQQVAIDLPKIRRGWALERTAALGARKAALYSAKERKKAQALIARKTGFLDSLHTFSEQISGILRVCYFLYHLNHYAKHGHSYLYDYKEKVLQFLWRDCKSELTETPLLLQVTFIPGAPRIRLCLDCRIKAKQQFQTHVEYIKSDGHSCTQCGKEEYYYSLYEFTLDYDEYHFCYHAPYSIARRWFTGLQINEKEVQVDREGFYAFGRAIRESEALAVSLHEVMTEIESFLSLHAAQETPVRY